jgi:CBS domain-containing protein
MILEQTVRQVLHEKQNTNIFTIGPNEMVSDALALMARQNAGALVVMEGEVMIGIVSERDYARKILLSGRSSRTTPVREIMTTKVLYVHPQDPLEGVLALMTDKRIRHVPVLDPESKELIGFISIGDVVKAVISDQGHLIDQLVRYISGSDYGYHEPMEDSRATAEERLVGTNQFPRLRGIN